jgi:hypothetical protein
MTVLKSRDAKSLQALARVDSEVMYCGDNLDQLAKLTFSDPGKIRELARRGEAWGTSEARQMLEHGIETGRGGCYLRLTPEQYKRLRQTKTTG